MADTSELRERFFDLYFPELQPWQSKLLDKCIGNARANDVRAEIKSARARDGGGDADPGVAQADRWIEGFDPAAGKGNVDDVRIVVDPSDGSAAGIAEFDINRHAYRVEALDGAVQFIPPMDPISEAYERLVRAGRHKAANALMKHLVDRVALSTFPPMMVKQKADGSLEPVFMDTVYAEPEQPRRLPPLVENRPLRPKPVERASFDNAPRQHRKRPFSLGPTRRPKEDPSAMVGWQPLREEA